MPVDLDQYHNVNSASGLKKVKFLSTLKHIVSCAGEKCYSEGFIHSWNRKLKIGSVQPITSTKVTQPNEQSWNTQVFLRSSIVENLSSNLDTIIAEGNNILCLNKTYRDWIVRISLPPTHRNEDIVHNVHPEDRQIYPNMTHVKYQQQRFVSDQMQEHTNHHLFQWPIAIDDVNGNYKKRNRDHAWDLIYSDDINIDEFYKMQSAGLKKRSIKNLEAQIQNPQSELVHKSWERAVNIMSNTITPNREDDTSKKDTDIMNNLLHKRSLAVSKCKEHGIFFNDIHVNNNSYFCDACKKRMKYSLNKEVIDHLFGSENKEGCCWNIIKTRQATAAKMVMEREVMNIIDSLLHPLLMKIKQQAQNDEHDLTRVAQRAPLNWKDVCNLWRETITAADPQRDIASENLRSFDMTMKVCDSCLPIPLNHDIVQITEQKLVNRYIDSKK
jgi:hypothetical protein